MSQLAKININMDQEEKNEIIWDSTLTKTHFKGKVR